MKITQLTNIENALTGLAPLNTSLTYQFAKNLNKVKKLTSQAKIDYELAQDGLHEKDSEGKKVLYVISLTNMETLRKHEAGETLAEGESLGYKFTDPTAAKELRETYLNDEH